MRNVFGWKEDGRKLMEFYYFHSEPTKIGEKIRMKMKSESSLAFWTKLTFHFEQKIELANATLTSSFALHPAMFKKLKFFLSFYLLAIHLATFKKFSFFFIYLGFFSRQFLFIYLNFKKTVLIFKLLVIFYYTFFIYLWSIHWYINF